MRTRPEPLADGLRARRLRVPVRADRRPDPVLVQRLAAQLRLARVHARLVPARCSRNDDLLDALFVTLEVAVVAVDRRRRSSGRCSGLGLARLRFRGTRRDGDAAARCRWSRPRSSWASACCCSSSQLFGAHGSLGQIVDRPHHVLHLVRGGHRPGAGRRAWTRSSRRRRATSARRRWGAFRYVTLPLLAPAIARRGDARVRAVVRRPTSSRRSTPASARRRCRSTSTARSSSA